MKKYIVILLVLTCSSVNASNQLTEIEAPIKKGLIKKAENNKQATQIKTTQKEATQERTKLAAKDKVFAKPTTKIKLAVNKKGVKETLSMQKVRLAKNDLPSLTEKP